MMEYRAVLLFALVSLLCATAAGARSPACDDAAKTPLNSFLWTIQRPGAPVYFFGTIHVPYTRVWDYIPQNAKDAFRNSDSVFFELDLTNHYTAAQLASCQLLPAGETLDKVLPRDLYRRLRKHFNYLKRKMPEWLRPPAGASAAAAAAGGGGASRPRADQHPMYADYQFNAMAGSWERLRPVWVMLTLNSLTESEVRSFGVPVLDLYLSQQAVRWSKRTGAIEKVEEQCTPLNQLSLNQVIFALNQTLTQHEQQREQSSPSVSSLNDDLIHHYSCGDLDTVLFSRDVSRVPAFGVSSPGGRPVATQLAPEQSRMAKEIDGYFQTELLYKRNERMAERVASLLRDHPKRSFFFAFGAGHFLGRNTVIDHLQRVGFTVNHLPAHQPIASFSQHEFATDMSIPVPLNPYIEALTSFNQMHSAKIRQQLHKQGRRQQLDPSGSSSVPSWRESKQAKQLSADQRQPSLSSTASSFNSLWKRIDAELLHDDALASVPEAETSPPASRPGRVWRPNQTSMASSSVARSCGWLLALTVVLNSGNLGI